MVTHTQVLGQLKRIGCQHPLWGSTEVAELSKLLMDGEEIALAINGYYSGGFGLLAVTNFRVLIIDKKPFTLNVEDLRYDMITEVNYGARIIIATIQISIPTRTLYFSSWSMDKLHQAMRHIQQHVMDARNGGSPLPDDWFAKQVSLDQPAYGTNRIIKLARSALRGHSMAAVAAPQLGFNSSLHAINPYAKMPSLARRRRYPSFYQ